MGNGVTYKTLIYNVEGEVDSLYLYKYEDGFTFWYRNTYYNNAPENNNYRTPIARENLLLFLDKVDDIGTYSTMFYARYKNEYTERGNIKFEKNTGELFANGVLNIMDHITGEFFPSKKIHLR